MAEILNRILATKAKEVAAARLSRPLAELHALARDLPPPRDFIGAIQAKHTAGKPAVIAEMKRASPSQGAFRSDFDPAAFAASYERHGAACLSVLTDAQYFGGSAEDLALARAACALPVLRKDFLIDPYQVVEARAMQADCILLIAGAISLPAMIEMAALAQTLGMAVLVESHTAAQLQEALQVPTPLIGINNRDLTTFKTDLAVTEALCPLIQANRITVAESGISEPAHVERLQAMKVNTYLVGGAFMFGKDPGEAMQLVFPSLA